VNRTFSKFLSISLVIGACAYGGYLLVRGTKEISMPSLFNPPSQASSGARLVMSMEDFRFAQSENGVISWRVDSKKAELFENKEAQLNDLEIDFKNPNGNEATLFGDTGTMDTANGNATIRRIWQDVRIATTDGYKLTTSSLFWKAGERRIWTSDPFKLLGSEINLEGVGVSANVDMRTIVVKDNVKAVLQR